MTIDDIKLDIKKRKIQIIDKLIWLRIQHLEKSFGKKNYDDLEDEILKTLDLFDDIV